MPVSPKLPWSRHGMSWYVVLLYDCVPEELQGGVYQFVITVYYNSEMDYLYLETSVPLNPANSPKKPPKT